MIEISKRVTDLAGYVFSQINDLVDERKEKGLDVISLAIGDPDHPTPSLIVEKMRETIKKPKNHVYSPYAGTIEFRKEVSLFLEKRFGISLSPEKEIIALIGSKEGIAHFPLAVGNPGDRALYVSPGFPMYETTMKFAGMEPISIPLTLENKFLANLSLLEAYYKKYSPKYFIFNYPHNPTGAIAEYEYLNDLVKLSKKHNVILASDNAYSEIYFEKKPLSILQIPEAKDIAIEFHSFSKTFHMTGWRMGFAVGNEKLVQALLKVKTHIDSGPLLSVQEVAQFALQNYDELTSQIRSLYSARREVLLKGFQQIGIEYFYPQATFYLWAKVPHSQSSFEFCKNLVSETGIVVTPGNGFGPEGEGFFRVALTVEKNVLENTINRMGLFLRETV